MPQVPWGMSPSSRSAPKNPRLFASLTASCPRCPQCAVSTTGYMFAHDYTGERKEINHESEKYIIILQWNAMLTWPSHYQQDGRIWPPNTDVNSVSIAHRQYQISQYQHFYQ